MGFNNKGSESVRSADLLASRGHSHSSWSSHLKHIKGLKGISQMNSRFLKLVPSRQRFLLRGRRNFSSNEKKPEVSTEEKAAEINKEAWPTVRKYAPLIVPTALFIVSSITMINNPAYRTFVEKNFPQYDNLVRTKYGYVEDLEERARVLEVERMLLKPVTVIVEFTSGQQEVVRAVDPSQSFDALFTVLEQKYEPEGRVIRSVTFADDDEVDADGGGSTTNNAIVPATLDPLWMPLVREQLKSRSKGYVHATIGTNDLQRNWWDTLATSTSSSAKDKRTIRISSSSSSSNSNKDSTAATAPLTKQILIDINHQNTVGSLLASYESYRRLENKNKLARKITVITGSSSSSGAPHTQHGLSKKALKALQQQEAKEAIASLERRIAALHSEKQYSRREIDDIENDISQLKTEITQLKRSHLNYFYFF